MNNSESEAWWFQKSESLPRERSECFRYEQSYCVPVGNAVWHFFRRNPTNTAGSGLGRRSDPEGLSK